MTIKQYTIYLIKEVGNFEKDSFIYVGRTNNYKRRVWQHKKNCTNRRSKKYKYKLYQHVRQLGGFDKFSFSTLDTADDEEDAKQLEILFYDMLKPICNTNTPLNKWNDYMRSYYKKNPEKRIAHNEYMKTKVICECGKSSARCNMTKHRKTKFHQDFISNN